MSRWPDSVVKEIFDLEFNCRMEELAWMHRRGRQRVQGWTSGIHSPGKVSEGKVALGTDAC